MRFPIMGAFLVAILLLAGCDSTRPVGEGGWLKGNTDRKFETVAKNLRGLDMAMVEVGYRYSELYWAGKDGNWEYADYLVKKIRLTIENALERRPKRIASAQGFLNTVLPAMADAVAKKDAALFERDYNGMTAGCNGCHELEKVAYMTIQPPEHRLSPIRPISETPPSDTP